MIHIDSHIESQDLIMALLDEDQDSITFVSEGGNGEKVNMDLTVAFNSDDDLRELFMEPEVQQRLQRLGLQVSYKR